MAKITIEADTETGAISCVVDGNSIDNIVDCSLYSTTNYDYNNGNNSPCCRFYASIKPKKEDGVTYYQSVQASRNPEFKKAIESGKAAYITDDVVLVKDNSVVSRDLANCLKR